MTIRNLLPLVFLTIPLHAQTIFIGTATGGKSTSKGIYRIEFDPATGTLGEPTLAVEYKNPGFLALHPTKPIVYACGQPTKAFDEPSDSVAGFTIGDDQSLTFLGEAPSGGSDACHIAVDATGSTVAVANYSNGNIATVTLDEDGVPLSNATVISNTGGSVNQNRQQGPHAHGVYFGKDNGLLYVPDLGRDSVLTYSFDPKTSLLGEALPPLRTAPGAGPRHMAVTPDWKHAYVVNELDNTVTAASFERGRLVKIDSVPTLPEDFTGSSSTAEIEVHPNGKFVYASNRGHDSIVVYSRDAETGKLTFLQHAPCGGKNPRHFKIDPTGKWLLCGHQSSNGISVLALDPETGKLGDASEPVAVPAPICLLFAR